MSRVAASDPEALRLAIEAMDDGELVIVPTDTRYAIAADALVEEAAVRAFDATARGADRALTIGVAGMEDAHHVAHVTPLARELAERHWPGPLSILLRARPWVPDVVTANGDTVALRAPANDFTRDLARHFGPITLTSVDDVAAFATGARVVVDAGPAPGGRATVVDATGAEAKVLRDGGLGALVHGPRGA